MTTPPRSSPAYQHYVHDFLAGRVATYTLEETGAYIILLDYEWSLNGLPNDRETLARLLRVSLRKFDALWAVLSEQFVERDGRYFNARLQLEREKQDAWREKSRRGGLASANQRGKGGSRVVEPPLQPNGNTPSPTPKRTTTTKDKNNAGAAPRASWLTPCAAAWEARFGAGSFPWPKAGRAMKPLQVAGHDPAVIADHLTRYLDSLTDVRFVSFPKFVETFGNWGPWVPTMPPVIDGWMSEELERLTRPAGMGRPQ